MKYLPLFFLTLLLSGCSLLSNDVATLWTNQPELAAYVELFNTSQKHYKIEIAYRSSPAQSLSSEHKMPDLVIGDRISSVNIIGMFNPLDAILGNGGIDTALFYKNLLSTGRYDGRQYLLPVSFDLPVILYQQTKGQSASKQTGVDLKKILSDSQDFNKKTTKSFKTVGFSPLWSPDFLFTTSELLGADFHQTSRGNLAWDDQQLKKSLGEMRSWVKEIDGGPQEEATFRDKYLYDPVYKLLDSGRILYYYTPLTKYFEIPESKRKSIGFRWLEDSSHIPVLENILYIGIPAHSHNKGAADAFLKWFFRPETQSQLLSVTRYERIKTFGIGDGFSSLSVVNERDYPQYYPSLLGRIPAASYLTYPKSLPSDWSDLKANVIIPWMREDVLGQGGVRQLQDRLKAWRLQKPLP